jgi:phosphoenolpyruvate carboxylase
MVQQKICQKLVFHDFFLACIMLKEYGCTNITQVPIDKYASKETNKLGAIPWITDTWGHLELRGLWQE